MTSSLEEKSPAIVLLVTRETFFPWIPVGIDVFVIHEVVEPESNKHKRGFEFFVEP